MNIEHQGYVITDEQDAVDLETVCALLHTTYWAGDRPKEVIAKSIQHSLCISVLADHRQVGFARVVTDHSTFGWIADLIIDPEHQGRGLGKAVVQFIQDHPDLHVGRQMLRTADAHGLYEQFGFYRDDCMSKVRPNL